MHNTTVGAAAPGKVTPENDNGLTTPHSQPAETHVNTSAAILTEADAERKRFDTLAARSARKGHTLAKLGSGYLLSRWGHVRHFVDLDTAEAMLRRNGAVSAAAPRNPKGRAA